jgi:Recombinase zinc beta ribbon domain
MTELLRGMLFCRACGQPMYRLTPTNGHAYYM